MGKRVTLKEVLGMSVPDRIKLAQDIWDSIADDPQALPLTREQKRELDRRLRAMKKNPEDHVSWEQVKAKIRGSRS
jgi:putative addiction module component (TIGR02574 family)